MLSRVYENIINIAGSLSQADPGTPDVLGIPTYETKSQNTNNIVILQDTTWTGTVDIKGKTVQVAEGVKLTISKGTKVIGAATNSQNGGQIDVWGSLIVDGQSDSLVHFEDVNINFGHSGFRHAAVIDIDFAYIKGGSFLSNWKNAGTLALKDSTLESLMGNFVIANPASDAVIARNIFKNSGGFEVTTSVSPTKTGELTGGTVSFQNNFFYDDRCCVGRCCI